MADAGMGGGYRSGPESRAFGTQLGGAIAHGGAEAGARICPTCGRRYAEGFNACPQDGTLLVDADEVVGTTLCGTYVVRRRLGEGSMGSVYEASHTRIHGKRFAVKLLHEEYARHPDVLERFQREAEAAASISSPHVVTVVDVDRTADGRPFLVSELLEGRELGDHLQEIGKLPASIAVPIARQIAAGVGVAHSRGVIHRDLKPENVFLVGDMKKPTAKVFDFGISRLDGREGRALTKLGAVIGTPSFMPPEQARGERVDARADVYSLGAILYTMLTGRRPFDSDNAFTTLTAVLTEDPPPPRSLEPSISPELERVIFRAMAKDAKDRYASMEELDGALGALGPLDRALEPPASSHQVTRTLADDPPEPPRGGAPERELYAMTAGVIAWATLALLAAASDLVHTASLAEGETALLVLAVLAAIAPPSAIVVLKVVKTARSPRAADTLRSRARMPLLAGLGAYGLGTVVVRLTEAAIGARAAGGGALLIDLLLIALAAGAGVIAVVLDKGGPVLATGRRPSA